jgi:hypothetical protein
MGLASSVLRLIIDMHGQRRWEGPVLTFGSQDVHASYPELTRAFEAAKVPAAPVPRNERTLSHSDYFRRVGWLNRNYVHARVFFRMLGIEQYDDLDFADFEKPSLICDLNEPVPEGWRGRYGMLVDGGTSEHIFNIRAVLFNIVSLLRVGGEVLHISPLSGWINHGFFHFSPCLFYDFYGCNGFEVGPSYIVDLPRDASGKESYRPYQYDSSSFEVDDAKARTLFVVRARKRVDQSVRLPTQGIYQQYAPQSGRVAG